MAPSRKTRRVLLGLVVVPLASAVGLEVGARTIDRVRGRPWDRTERREAVETFCRMLTRISYETADAKDAAEARRLSRQSILSPYTGWEEQVVQERIVEDRAYYRTDEAAATFDVLVVGGSVAYHFAELGRDRLTAVLAADPRFRGRAIRVHNYAVGGYKQPQTSTLLAYLLASGHQPDLVLAIDGFNEAALGWTNAHEGTHPGYPSLPHWFAAKGDDDTGDETVELLYQVLASQDRARGIGEWYLRSGLDWSCFLDHSFGLALDKARIEYRRAYLSLTHHLASRSKGPEMRGPPFAEDEDRLAETIVGIWEEGSANLYGMCTAKGIPYLGVLQPTLHDRGSKPLTEKEIETGTAIEPWIEGVAACYGRMREAGGRLRARGVPYLDASRVFEDDEETLYYDACHFVERGNEILADAVGGALLAGLER